MRSAGVAMPSVIYGSASAAAPPRFSLAPVMPIMPVKLFLTIVLLYPFLTSCAVLPPAATEESSPAYAAIEDVTPQWRPWSQGSGSQTPGPGYFSGSIQRPRLKFHAIRVDLNDPSLKIVINHEVAAENPDAIASTFVSSFVRRYDCLAGINTAPFDPSSGKEGEARVIKGISIAGGILLSPPHPAYDALVFYKDGRAAIVKQSEIETFDAIENAAGGFFRVLEKGKLAARLFTGGSPHEDRLIKNTPSYPRSAAGLSPDGRYLYLLVIDGRQKNSAGATGAETGRLLKQLGASEGLYFDGGGSTALALRYPDGQVKIVNTPVHNNVPGRERAVASCLGIAFVDPD
ncbi:hypothetical protein FACS189498_0650 [Spirochaetia bacterium]|nr:hypothetical protein FACS189498_0650 [Spirochaetia bacterium]